MDIIGKNIIITGGAKGIGKECAIKLANLGANIIAIDIDEKNGTQLEKLINKPKTIFIKADVSKENEIKEISEYVKKQYGKIDILINNAAKQSESNFFKTSVNDFKEVIDVNLMGTFICSKYFGSEIDAGSKIINMLSIHYELPRKNKYSYDASKAAIAMLTKEMALELSEKGVNVLGISYGACDTPMNSNWMNNKSKREEALRRIPLKWIAQPEEIANFVKIILEEFSDYTTGSIFTIDGGRSISLIN